MTFGSNKTKFYIEFDKKEYKDLKVGKTLHHYVENKDECAEIKLSFDYKKRGTTKC